ncbi:tyrosine-type recombinase/integrase [Sphingobacterium sp. 1.A.5]|uniref:tyrosine-type recombinase/integrase n=1 Tax=Sphingobacterium sp. 1.A.5 TaxID=2044604 RepID=UPI0015D51EF0|nr:tyrosine-type recombinase/integrase [Sphingobacterium sp. 1.A.5]
MANYTIPKINFGKNCRTKAEQAKTKWVIEFTIGDQRKRVSNGLNRLLNYDKKLSEFNKLRDSIENELKEGTYNLPKAKPVIIPTVKTAVKEFIQWHKNKGSRLKTVQSYESKLKYISDELGNTNINSIYHKDINDLMMSLQNDLKWSNKTYNNAKGIYSGLFAFAIDSRYIDTNPVSRIKSKYVSKSERNKAFSKDDFNKIMTEVDKDVMLSMFVRSIYYTCIRPRELCSLQVKHINWNKRTIYIPADISKNKKDGYVHIDDNFYKLLKQYYFNAPADSYLFCNDVVLWGTLSYHPNRPYKRFIRIIDKLGLSKKGYTLYSVKHYSNVQKFLNGWTVAEIMKANRHASIEETENYLRDLLEYVDITKKVVPAL